MVIKRLGENAGTYGVETCPKDRTAYGLGCKETCDLIIVRNSQGEPVDQNGNPIPKDKPVLTDPALCPIFTPRMTSGDPKANPGKTPSSSETRQKTGSRYPNGN